MVLVLCPSPRASVLAYPFQQTPPLSLPLWHLQALLPPQPMYPLLVHQPALPPQERPHPPVAIARVFAGESDHSLDQPAVLLGLATHVAMSGPGLTDRPACPTLGDPQPPTNVLDGGLPPDRARKFPRLTSLRMLMSTAWSATIFFKRAFSFSSSLRCFMVWAFIPPYRFLQRCKVASLTPSFLATSGIGAPAAIWASTPRSLRTICSGVCLFLIENPPIAHLRPSDSHSSWLSFQGAGHMPIPIKLLSVGDVKKLSSIYCVLFV